MEYISYYNNNIEIEKLMTKWKSTECVKCVLVDRKNQDIKNDTWAYKREWDLTPYYPSLNIKNYNVFFLNK